MTATPKERFVFIDALRGVAALGVLYHHLLHNSVLEVTLRGIMPRWSTLLSDWGALGVRIFFVLSGFVIAHSLRASRVDGKSVVNFAIRRQLRLDPPYWCIIALVLALQAVRLRFPSLVTPPLPGAGTVVLNMLYLHNLTGVATIVDVAWTLCLEIQFYLVFIVLLALAARWPERRAALAAGLVFATGCASMAAIFLGSWKAWFIPYWFHFAAGVLCYWAVRGTVRRGVFLSFAAVMLATQVLSLFVPPVGTEFSGPPTIGVGLATALAIYVVGIAGRLTTLWRHPVLQYFGRISYSMYLVHLAVITTVMNAAYKITGQNGPLALLWLVLAGALSIGAGHLLFILIERPCMRFASTFRRHPEEAAPVPGETVAAS